ncbi:uncharacterized protein M421DRAFT_415776 [Didymella exigua CBS 183.55]|uniref:KANL3/Tex30 alpha/beta hydrolase-like domain-containing protein n=1 Tax=Didymella exigua CBS 183.55 TaxID=1150837 RepID=A0A6A5S0P3_9PLEO|nr:uncharacterized protein M421DRAFT_415776 [Didymella exigua CBS 183.55]KAF1933433.1 hypothetical protein M421DRAFT_415776 [Didymella exigua CBS 183.55]
MGTGRMAPAVPRAARNTRSSTRLQTQKSYQNEYTSKAKHTGRVQKKHLDPANNAHKTNKTATSAPKASATKSAAPDKLDAISARSSSTTTFSIDSDLLSKSIVCYRYIPTAQKEVAKNTAHFIFTHGAGGTLSAPAVVNFCTGFASTSSTPLLAFQGSSNLGARVKGFHACHGHLGSGAKDLVFGGRSMGARAAVMAATELIADRKWDENGKMRLLLVSYPLQGPKDVRDQILLDLPEDTDVLFVVGDRDAMCPLDLLEEVRRKMVAKSRLVVVRSADHGMKIKPASRTKEVGEETGMAAARWLSGEIESGGETLYVDDEDEE